ncbi:MAG TPA: polyphosphate kinase 1 [Candidatus Angelobacter sp.]|nr:polyphosphate kinase 1 [Candidatus Angelobacter sp.]
MIRKSLENPAYYLNAEKSWLAFNRRVLEEAADETNPVLERVKFLAITASNLDEFFEVRVAGLLQRIEDGSVEPGPDGMVPTRERDMIAQETQEFASRQHQCWNERLRPLLAENGIRVLGLQELSPKARAFVEEYCDRELDPLLTPVTVDPAHPFPRVINKALCLGLLLKRGRRASSNYTGVVTVPRALPRLIRVPNSDFIDYVFLADLVALHAHKMYRGYDIVSSAAFRVTRNSNLYLQEEDSRNLLDTVRTELHNRRKGAAVRMEIEADADPEIVDRLRSNFDLDSWQIFPAEGPVNLSRLFNIYDQTDRPDLKFKSFAPRELHLTGKSRDMFEELRRGDILLHHPFDSFDGVLSFIESAVEDPNVLSIKQTLYRTSENSPIVGALMEAAAKKEVTVVVEVKARFDEASNIRWARTLEDAGVQVFHGLVGLKTHCKLLLLARRDPDGITRRYAHLGTGNYNSTTARLYTDLSLLTADPEITMAVHGIFSFLTAYAERPNYAPLLVSPLDCAQGSLNLIAREAEHAEKGRPARIVAKMNGLLDKAIIQALYRASQAGVEIDLIVRGMCALRPGVRGVSERIRVRSIVGRFLERSRIFCFANGGDEEIYLGSADWMPRNLYERVEVMFPVKEPLLRQRISQEIIDAYLADRAKSRFLQPDGSYLRAHQLTRKRRMIADETNPLVQLPDLNAQEFLLALAEGKRPSQTPVTPRQTRARRQMAME